MTPDQIMALISDEVVERAARAACKSVEDREHGRNPHGQPAWRYLGYLTQEAFIDAAWPNYADQCRATLAAGIAGWKGVQLITEGEPGREHSEIILPLPEVPHDC